jgi:hypothetical protein
LEFAIDEVIGVPVRACATLSLRQKAPSIPSPAKPLGRKIRGTIALNLKGWNFAVNLDLLHALASVWNLEFGIASSEGP